MMFHLSPAPGEHCPNCLESVAEPAMYEGDLFVAVECPVCGVRGPIRSLLNKTVFEQVAKLAIDDWRKLFFTPSVLRSADDRAPRVITAMPGDSGSADTSSNTPPEKAPIDAPVSPEHSTSRAARMAARLVGSDPGASKLQVPKPPDDGGGEGAGLPVFSDYQLNTRARLAKFLNDIGMSAEMAVDKGMQLGVSKATLYNILKGQAVRSQSLDAVNAALDKNERGRKLSGAASAKPAAQKAALQTDYDESLVQQLPNKFQDTTGTNRCPPPVAPARCASTP
jgi:hypothetical protein